VFLDKVKASRASVVINEYAMEYAAATEPDTESKIRAVREQELRANTMLLRDAEENISVVNESARHR
jgi:hypothetical protein